MKIHPTSIISKDVKVEKDVFIGPFCNLQNNVIIGDSTKIFGWLNAYNCKIGSNCKIGPFVEIQNNVIIGNNCKIQSHSFICEGTSIEDGVFIGHNVVFINDKNPRAINKKGHLKSKKEWKLAKPKVYFGASIGSGAVIFPVKIGRWAMVGAGAVVTEDVCDHGLVYGVPAQLKGFICKCGYLLDMNPVKENQANFFLKCKKCSKIVPIERKNYKKVKLRFSS